MKITNLNFSYDTLEVFSSAEISFEFGVNIITGPSGCGKTTLLKLLSGALAGSGLDTDTPLKSSLLVLQEDALIPWLTGWENIEFSLSKKNITRELIEIHPLVELADEFLDKSAWQMSHGQRRTIELIRALIFEPEILCLDEPLNFIDPDRRAILSKAMFHDNRSKYTLISTHESNDFVRYVNSAQNFDGRFPVSKLIHKNL